MKSSIKCLRRFIAPAMATMLFVAPVEAQRLTEITFAGGTIGQTLADNPAINGVGMVANFDGFVSPAELSYVEGLTGSLGTFDNAIQTSGMSTRVRMIIDRTTPEWLASGLLLDVEDPNSLIGADGSTLYGSVLIENSVGTATGFTGLEFAIGDPNANRKITIGEADAETGLDHVVLGPGQAGQNVANDLDLPSIVANETREIVFRIDYGTDGNTQTAVDTFTLINEDGTDGVSGMGEFTFSTFHIASFTGAPSITYDDIRLGATLGDVRFVEGTTILGDFDNDGDVDIDDLDQYNGNLGQTPTGALAPLDLDDDGDIDLDDLEQHYTDLVETSNGEKGTFAGDLNLDGTVNVLGDAFPLVGNLNNSATSWSQGDFNADGNVNVLGDAFALVGNLGKSNETPEAPSNSAVPEPGSMVLITLAGIGIVSLRKRYS